MRQRSYTYELMEERSLLFAVKRLLAEGGRGWQEVGDLMPEGHVEYKPQRVAPLKSGYQFQYQKAGLNLTLYFPEKTFNRLVDMLDRERVPQLKRAFQQVLPERSGYVINEFKIRGILEGPEIQETVDEEPAPS